MGCKINQTIVYGVIQTLAIVQRSNLDFFLAVANDLLLHKFKMASDCINVLRNVQGSARAVQSCRQGDQSENGEFHVGRSHL